MKIKNTENSITDPYSVKGLVQISKPHNEKPVAKMNVQELKAVVEIAELLGIENAFLWDSELEPRCGHESHGLVFTDSLDSDVGVAIAGMLEREIPGENE